MFKKYQLRNGMTVILAESHKSPVVTVQMWVRTGSADERKKEQGISHFIEHLVFKGSQSFGVGEMAASVEGAGGELNAYTSFDETVFYVTISKKFTGVALKVIHEMMTCPTFDPSEIDKEREVVIEEIKRTMDNPARESSRLLFSTVFKKHPYGVPVIGYPEIVKNVSKKTLVDYFRTRYTPKQMTLVIVGDFATNDMKKEISALYGEFDRGPLRKVARIKEPKQTSARVKVKKSKFEESFLSIAWKGPKPVDKDIAPLDILALVLGQGESSRLLKKVRLDKPLVTSVSSGLYAPQDGGFFAVSATLNRENTKEYLDEALKELTNLLMATPTEEEIARAITNFASEEFYSVETVDGMARKYGFYENLMRDPGYFTTFMKRVKSLKPSDMTKAARKYLNPKHMTITMVTNGEEKSLEKELKSFVGAYTKAYKQASAKKVATPLKTKFKALKLDWKPAPSTPDIRKVTLKNGVDLILRPSREAPTISVRAAFLGGLRLEQAGEEGLTELLANTWTAGTESRDEIQVYKEVESLAAQLSAFGGRNSTGLSMEMLAPVEKQAIDLFTEALTRPRFSEEIIAREKDVMLEHIKTIEDRPSSIVMQQFMAAMFAGHPYSRDLLGTEATVSKFVRQDILRHWKRFASRKNLTISISGCFDEKLWKERLEKDLLVLPDGERFTKKFTATAPSLEKALVRKLEKEQTHIVVGFPGLKHSDSERYALQVMQAVLAGQGGRLFLELRDKMSLAYSVSPVRMEGIDAGYFGGYIACSPEKAKISVDMLMKEFRKLVDTPLTTDELERAKRYLIGRHDIDLQRNSTVAGAALFDYLYGLPFDETFRHGELLEKVTVGEVQKLAKKIFSQPPTISVVGKSFEEPRSESKADAELQA